MSDDWLYNEERLKLRAVCLSTLMKTFGWELNSAGLPKYNMEKIHNCAHDWVSQGHPTAIGINKYFLKNYTKG